MSNQIKACLIPVGGEPVEISLAADDLLSLQNHVGGMVEVLNVKGDGIDLWVNEEGLSTCPPNRAVYADKYMEQKGYLNQMDYASPVKEGNLYTVLFGNIVAARHDGEGGMASLTDEDIAALKQEYADPSTGIKEVQKILHHSQQKENADKGVSLSTEAKDAREASGELGSSGDKPISQERE